MSTILLYIGCGFMALAFILATIAHTFRAPARKVNDDPAWASGILGFVFIIASIVMGVFG